MTLEFRLPDLGEGLVEAEIVQWHVSEGDEIALNQTLVEVETAKAVVEIPSPRAGVVNRLHARAGDTVSVGEPLVTYAGEQVPVGDSTPTPNLVGYGAAQARTGRAHRRTRRISVAPVAPADIAGDRPRSTPPVRTLAKHLGVSLTDVVPHGPAGMITRADVEAFAARMGGATPRSVERSETRVPIRGVRKSTAAAMVSSAHTAPQASTFLTVDVTATTELLAGLRTDRSLDGHRIGILAFVAKAVCLALRRTPELGSRWDEAAEQIVQPRYVDLGIAAATDRGLVVPHVADADRLDLVHLADAIGEAVDAARAGRSDLAALAAGTFTITNVGVFGVDGGTPILFPGEAGILALGAVRRMPWEHEGAIALRDVLTLTLVFDHRVCDGAEAARFLTDVAAVLREPGRAMLLA